MMEPSSLLEVWNRLSDAFDGDLSEARVPQAIQMIVGYLTENEDVQAGGFLLAKAASTAAVEAMVMERWLEQLQRRGSRSDHDLISDFLVDVLDTLGPRRDEAIALLGRYLPESLARSNSPSPGNPRPRLPPPPQLRVEFDRAAEADGFTLREDLEAQLAKALAAKGD